MFFYSQNDHTLSLFDQTVRDTDEEFYATFPDAREALARSTAIFTPNDDSQQLSYSYSCQSQDQQEYSWTDLEPSPVKPTFLYISSSQQSDRLAQVNGSHTYFNSAFSHHSISLPSYPEVPEPHASSNYALPYHQQYTHPDLTPPATTQSPFDAVSPSTPISFTSSGLAGPSVSNITSFPGRVASVDQIRSRDTPSAPNLQARKLRRTLRSPIPELTNGCELVMRLEDFSEPLSSRETSAQTSHFHTKQRRAHSLSHPPSRALTWDPALSSPRSSSHLSPLPNNKHQSEKKPPLACLFCRGRKIACGPPLPGSLNKTCNQCQRRSLRCEYPSESRRGMRKKKSSPITEATAPDN